MQELIDRIYRAMGIDSSVIPQDVVEGFLEDWLTVYPDNECLALHNTVVSLYEYLIKSSASDGSGGGKRREKRGKTEIEVDGYNKSSDWQSALDDYLESPWYAFPTCRDELSQNLAGSRVIVGGVDEDKITEINNDDNIRTGGASEVDGVKQTNPYRYFYTDLKHPFTFRRR